MFDNPLHSRDINMLNVLSNRPLAAGRSLLQVPGCLARHGRTQSRCCSQLAFVPNTAEAVVKGARK